MSMLTSSEKLNIELTVLQNLRHKKRWITIMTIFSRKNPTNIDHSFWQNAQKHVNILKFHGRPGSIGNHNDPSSHQR